MPFFRKPNLEKMYCMHNCKHRDCAKVRKEIKSGYWFCTQCKKEIKTNDMYVIEDKGVLCIDCA